ncbi:unnamed protein product [marine sediment metagenome]|uniref:Uncharacterized protein n=1 Tax=marine sediment metagenome TaxID=412755 RepID=X1NGW5_9ZZZZ
MVNKPPDMHSQFDRNPGNYRPLVSFATVGLVSGAILEGNERRKGLTFTNSSVGWIWLSKSDGNTPAVVGSGNGVAPNGTGEDVPDNLAYLYRGPWQAISTVAAANLGITED